MLKAVKTRASEALGLTPSVADATAAAETHRHALIAAQGALEAAGDALQAAHDRDADDVQLKRLEAAQAAAKAGLSRAEARYIGAERRLAAALDAETAKVKAGAVDRLKDALAIRAKAAAEIDRLAAEIARHVASIDEQDSVLAESIRDHAAPREAISLFGRGRRAAELALSKAGAINRVFMGDPTQAPGAVDVIGRDNEALAGRTGA